MRKLIIFLVTGMLWCNVSFSKIVIPTHNWNSQIVMAYVIGGIFENMGYRVEYVNIDSQKVYKSIGKGKVSISHEVWESAFGRSFENEVSRGNVIDAGEHAAFTMEDMGVPNWVIEKNLCPGLPDWTALKNPDCIKNFIRSGTYGIWLEGPKSWHGDLIPQRLAALGLSNLWTVKFAGSANELWSELARAKSEGRGIIIFNWTPNFTDMEGFTMIEFPPYYSGCRPTDGGSGKCGSPTGYLKKAASREFASKYPDAFRVFKRISFTTKDIGTMAGYVDVYKRSHQDAARQWLSENKHKWEYWTGRTNVVYNAEEQQRLDRNGKTKIAKKEPKKKKPKKKDPKITPGDDKIVAAAMGSGFFVSRTGHIITNHHVIDQCQMVTVNFKGDNIKAKILAVDKTNDLAIIKSKITPDKVLSVSNEDVSLLQDVIVAGFPLGKKVSSSIKMHKGSVTSLAGFGDNYSNFQTDATINQGNSGGPVMDRNGNVVGVAVALMPAEAGQNIFFAVKSSTLKAFANANSLSFLSPNNRPMSNKDLGNLISSSTVYLDCFMTIAKIKQLIAKENRKAFYKEYQQ